MTSTNLNMFNLEKLSGRENFAAWKFCMKTYLEHEGLWECIQPPEGKTVDPNKDVKAKSKLILSISSQNYVHVQDCNSAKEVWVNLHKAFDDNGLTRKVGLLKELINTSLDSSDGIEDYVSKIMNAAHKLRNISFDIDDQWLGTLMLAGLPEEYKPMIMGLENSGATISADLIKTKLLQEVKTPNTNTAFFSDSRKGKQFQHKSKPQPNKTKGPRCYSCNGYGHFAKYCQYTKKTYNKEHSKQGSSSFAAAFPATTSEMKGSWFIDSGASMHMVGNRDSMYNVREPSVTSITVANREPLPVKAAGEVNVRVSQGGEIQLRNVLHVPGLAANLISVSAVTRSGYKVVFHEKGCLVMDRSEKVLCSATLVNKLYALDIHKEEETAHLASDKANSSQTKLWHLRMAHLNVADLQKLPGCAEGVTLAAGCQQKLLCTGCLEGKQTRLPFKHAGTRATKKLELVHTDMCGPMECTSYGVTSSEEVESEKSESPESPTCPETPDGSCCSKLTEDIYQTYGQIKNVFKKNPAPDGHRCGVCPTYFQKICAFDFKTNQTYIFDNHCIMDLYNCLHKTDFLSVHWESCIYFGNFAYVHGIKHEDQDYDEDHIIIKGANKNPDFVY